MVRSYPKVVARLATMPDELLRARQEEEQLAEKRAERQANCEHVFDYFMDSMKCRKCGYIEWVYHPLAVET